MSNDDLPNSRLIVAFVGDLMVAIKIENVASRLGYRVTFIGQANEIAQGEAPDPKNRPAEPVFGRDAVLFEKITTWQPALLIFDLGNEAIPWRHWVALFKSSPSTRRIPILSYGPHVKKEDLLSARDMGTNAVVARSRFMSALPDLIEKYARTPDHGAIAESCREPLPALAFRGIHEFNRGDYFESHELLEEAWNLDGSPARDLYRAILQVAVAYLQIERDNYQGAVKMFLRMRQWLLQLPDICRSIDIADLKSNANDVHEEILRLGPERLKEFDRSLFKPIRIVELL
jgi:CheY-like chemotaxis protein